MDSVHEAHLSRILEARRRRGVLGTFSEAVAAPSSRGDTNDVMVQSLRAPSIQRCSTSAYTQTDTGAKMTASVQTVPLLAVPLSAPPFAHSSTEASAVPSGGAAPDPPPLTSPDTNLTLDGGVRFQSPGRVPSLAYSTPSSVWRRRTRLRQSAASSSSSPLGPWGGAQGGAHHIQPLPSPLYVRRLRSVSLEPLYFRHGTSAAPRGRLGSFPRSPTFTFAPKGLNKWESYSRTPMRTSPTAWSRGHKSSPSEWADKLATTPLTASTSRKTNDHQEQQQLWLGSRSCHSRQNGVQLCDDDDSDSAHLPPERHSHFGHKKTLPRDQSRRRREKSPQHREVIGNEGRTGSTERHPGHGEGFPAQHQGGLYTLPVVYTGPATLASPPSSSLRRDRPERLRSASAGLPQDSPQQPPLHVQAERQLTVGLPEVRSTMDLRTSIETLRCGDWFYKWSLNGDAVYRRWVWMDTKSYLLLWSSYETLSLRFHSSVRLDHIYRVTPRDLSSVDKDGFTRTYYVLVIETTNRVLQLATELRDKFNAWFEALNNVMFFLHYKGTSKQALAP